MATRTDKRSKPKLTRRTRKTKITVEQIAERAYFLSLEGDADPIANWLQAERELTGL
jgi:hypothetical protein